MIEMLLLETLVRRRKAMGFGQLRFSFLSPLSAFSRSSASSLGEITKTSRVSMMLWGRRLVASEADTAASAFPGGKDGKKNWSSCLRACM